MIGNHSDLKVVLVTGPIDFRAGVNRLVSIVANALHRDPYCGQVFVFRSKRMDRLKLIHFDGSGMCLMTKWLEGGRFKWPPIENGVMKLTQAQMTLLLGGMDWRKCGQKTANDGLENGDFAGFLRRSALDNGGDRAASKYSRCTRRDDPEGRRT